MAEKIYKRQSMKLKALIVLILGLAFLLAFANDLFSQGVREKASYFVNNRTTVFGRTLPPNSLIMQTDSMKYWYNTAQALATDNLASISKKRFSPLAEKGVNFLWNEPILTYVNFAGSYHLLGTEAFASGVTQKTDDTLAECTYKNFTTNEIRSFSVHRSYMSAHFSRSNGEDNKLRFFNDSISLFMNGIRSTVWDTIGNAKFYKNLHILGTTQFGANADSCYVTPNSGYGMTLSSYTGHNLSKLELHKKAANLQAVMGRKISSTLALGLSGVTLEKQNIVTTSKLILADDSVFLSGTSKRFNVGTDYVDNKWDLKVYGSTTVKGAFTANGAATLTGILDVTGAQTNASTITQTTPLSMESAALGAEVLTSWTVGANWVEAPAGTFTNTSATPTTLTSNVLTAAGKYQFSITTSGDVGALTITYGGLTTTVSTTVAPATYTFGGTTTSTAAMVITPNAAADAVVVTAISLKPITSYEGTFVMKDATLANSFEIRNSAASLNNTFIGKDAGYSNTTGYSNTFNGVQSGYSNTTGSSNTFNGTLAGYSNTTGNSNTFNGTNAGYSNTTGNSNTFNGMSAGSANTTGNNNTFNGMYAGYSNTTGSTNTFNGMYAGYFNTIGNYNTFNGAYAGRSNTIGNYNTFNGMYAGSYLLDGGTSNSTGNNNDYHGYATRSFAATQSYEIAIGSTCKGNGSNTVSLGGANNAATTWTLSYNNTNTQAGNNLTIKAQSAFDGGTADQNGGMLQNNPGNSKGMGFASYRAGRNSRAASTGTALNTISDAIIVPSENNMVDNVDKNLFEVALATDAGSGGEIAYSIVATDGDTTDVRTGKVLYALADGNATVLATITESDGVAVNVPAAITDMVVTWTATASGGTKVIISAKTDISFQATAIKINYTITNNGTTVITQL